MFASVDQSNPESATVVSETHHYVPKFYLKGFTDQKGVLWVYERGKAPRASKPKAEAHRENYYLHNDKGFPDTSIERFLSKAESIVAPFFRKIANPQFQINEQQRNDLFAFVAMTFVRVPAYRSYIDRGLSVMMKKNQKEYAQNAEKFYALCKKIDSETGGPTGDYEDLRQFILKGEYTIHQTSSGYNIAMAFKSCMTIMEILRNEYNYEIWYAPPDGFFFTCDNPVVTIRPAGDRTSFVGWGFGWKDTQVIFPLNKRACLSLRRGCSEQKTVISSRRRQQINDLMMAVSQQHLYAPLGYRRISRLFEERGCKVKYGENALITPELSESFSLRITDHDQKTTT